MMWPLAPRRANDMKRQWSVRCDGRNVVRPRLNERLLRSSLASCKVVRTWTCANDRRASSWNSTSTVTLSVGSRLASHARRHFALPKQRPRYYQRTNHVISWAVDFQKRLFIMFLSVLICSIASCQHAMRDTGRYFYGKAIRAFACRERLKSLVLEPPVH